MSLVIRFSPPSLTAEQYDSVVQRMNDDGVMPADGLDYEICFGEPGSLKVSQVWDSQEQMDAFGAQLMPILAACRPSTVIMKKPRLGVSFSGAPRPAR